LVSELYEDVLDTVVMSNAVHVYVSQAHKGELVMGAGIDSYNSYRQRGSFHVIEDQIAAAVELFPIFSSAHLLRTWAGIVDVCPDASPIVGATPVENLFLNCGWGTGGFKATPGSGGAFAWTLAHGAPHELNRPFPLERFVTGAGIDQHGAAGGEHRLRPRHAAGAGRAAGATAPIAEGGRGSGSRRSRQRRATRTGRGSCSSATSRRASSRSGGCTSTAAVAGSTSSGTPHEAPLDGADIRTCGLCPCVRLRRQREALSG